ncbi:unnamed protein product [Notodromas monacha]|uniref:C2H2-type domain-containing protein n=1 Tax=Notodromas monacha TaxID=399045 RepID=A0A7R9BP14_9CRUS|nr:unnamed protein product [Notodromas monacha]CAG0917658.1 unnamed protein product [Notodromas monacha]
MKSVMSAGRPLDPLCFVCGCYSKESDDLDDDSLVTGSSVFERLVALLAKKLESLESAVRTALESSRGKYCLCPSCESLVSTIDCLEKELDKNIQKLWSSEIHVAIRQLWPDAVDELKPFTPQPSTISENHRVDNPPPIQTRKRGRACKNDFSSVSIDASLNRAEKVSSRRREVKERVKNVIEEEVVVKRRRGRPRKSDITVPPPVETILNVPASHEVLVDPSNGFIAKIEAPDNVDDVDEQKFSVTSEEIQPKDPDDFQSAVEEDGNLEPAKELPGAFMWLNWRCRICGQISPDAKEFSSHHQRYHPDSSLHSCHFCFAKFNDADEFRNHVFYEELDKCMKKDFRCVECDVDFVSPRRLNDHMRSAHVGGECANSPFQCLECDGVRFDTFQEYIYHRASDEASHVVPEGLANFACNCADGCDFKGRTDEELVEHASAIHDNKTPFQCPRCRISVPSWKRMARHVVKLEYGKKYCEECGLFFKTPHHTEWHINETHLKRSPYACSECNKSFPSKRQLLYHMEYHKPKPEKLCNVCGKYYKGCLSYHVRAVHNKERRIKCELCDETFFHYAPKRNHLAKVHGIKADRRVNTCELCGKVFVTKDSLKIHRFTVHGIRGLKTYACPTCGKEYIERKRLEEHIMAHDGVKPNACPMCDHRTITFVNLKTHIKLVHKKKVFRKWTVDEAGNKTYVIVDHEQDLSDFKNQT